MLLTFTKPRFEQLIKDCVKVHTIRADKGNRWYIGTKIHFWLGNPRNTRGKVKPYQFGVGEVSRVETIRMDFASRLSAISSARFAILLTLTPSAGFNS